MAQCDDSCCLRGLSSADLMEIADNDLAFSQFMRSISSGNLQDWPGSEHGGPERMFSRPQRTSFHRTGYRIGRFQQWLKPQYSPPNRTLSLNDAPGTTDTMSSNRDFIPFPIRGMASFPLFRGSSPVEYVDLQNSSLSDSQTSVFGYGEDDSPSSSTKMSQLSSRLSDNIWLKQPSPDHLQAGNSWWRRLRRRSRHPVCPLLCVTEDDEQLRIRFMQRMNYYSSSEYYDSQRRSWFARMMSRAKNSFIWWVRQICVCGLNPFRRQHNQPH